MAEIRTETIMVNFGPQHPSTHGVLFVLVELDGEVVVGVEPKIGYLHRAIEKLSENRKYNQVIPLFDRCDYLSAFSNELGYVMAVEKLLGVEVPERAEYIRVILVELNRIASHLLWLSAYGLDLGALTPLFYAFREREKILDLFEMAAGYRLMPNYLRFGGVKEDLPSDFTKKALEFVEEFPSRVDEYEGLLSENEIFLVRTKGIGKWKREEMINVGVTGPMLRATGLKWDLRKSEPYSIYDRFEFEIPVGENSDCYDVYQIRMKEMRESAKIVRQAIEGLPEGKVRAKLPLVVKPPAGESYVRIEAPRGELGVQVVSDGSEQPYRVKIRTPSFVNLMALPVILKGWKVADFIAILGILDVVLGEVDR